MTGAQRSGLTAPRDDPQPPNPRAGASPKNSWEEVSLGGGRKHWGQRRGGKRLKKPSVRETVGREEEGEGPCAWLMSLVSNLWVVGPGGF